MYETLVELHKNMEELKRMACPVGMSEGIINGSEAPRKRVPLDLDKIISMIAWSTTQGHDPRGGYLRANYRSWPAPAACWTLSSASATSSPREAVVHTCIAGGIALPQRPHQRRQRAGHRHRHQPQWL
jgi:hypothetical protein